MVLTLLTTALLAASPAPRVQGGIYAWTLRHLDSEGGSRQVTGGRLLGSVTIGRARLGARADFASLPDHKGLSLDPDAYESGEFIASAGLDLYRHEAGPEGPEVGVGPAVIAGYSTNLRDGGEGKPIVGVGLSVHLGRDSWAYLLVVRHEAVSKHARAGAGVQVKMPTGLYLVADGVSGPGGFLRLGVAARVP